VKGKRGKKGQTVDSGRGRIVDELARNPAERLYPDRRLREVVD
jgi:hypothetical protein